MSYDSTKDTQEHIEKVYCLIWRFVDELVGRASSHDVSKLGPPEKGGFDKYSPLLRDTTYGSDEYKQYLEEMEAVLEHHYENNKHHPEHHKLGIHGMTLVDIVEMFCDWKAATMRHADGDFTASLEHNRKRFNIGPQLYNILINTANEFDLLNSG